MSDTVTATVGTAEAAPVAPRGVWRTLRRRPAFWTCAALLTVLALVALVPQWFAGWFGQPDPRACDLGASAQPPGGSHVFGTDVQGCDVYAKVIYGTRASLTVGLLCTALALVVRASDGVPRRVRRLCLAPGARYCGSRVIPS